MPEGMSLEQQLPTKEWEKSTERFHLDPEKSVDPVESLLEKTGDIDVAFDEIVEALDKDPNNRELHRQANLLVNRLDDLAAKLRDKISS